jgi:UDP-N-acetylglucosamine transferase subunit ALG13
VSGSGDGDPRPVILVTVGTMHHRFNRLMDWVESWLRSRPDAARVVVQHGTSRLPDGAEGFPMCSRDELLEIIRDSQVVVTQGGPGGIMDARDCGIMPIVVPRRAELDEHVDDHQVRFCGYMVREGLIQLADTEEQLHARLDAAVADPAALQVAVEAADVEAAVTRTGELIEDLVRRKPARHRRKSAAR